MPYVDESTANMLDVSMDPQTPGELNYTLSRLALDYFKSTRQKYSDMAEVVAAFECAKLEFYRRVMAPYESLQAALPGRDLYSDE